MLQLRADHAPHSCVVCCVARWDYLACTPAHPPMMCVHSLHPCVILRRNRRRALRLRCPPVRCTSLPACAWGQHNTNVSSRVVEATTSHRSTGGPGVLWIVLAAPAALNPQAAVGEVAVSPSVWGVGTRRPPTLGGEPLCQGGHGGSGLEVLGGHVFLQRWGA